MAPVQQPLQIVYLWRDNLLGYWLLGRGDGLSIGTSKRATIKALLPEGFPRHFPVVKSTRQGHRVRVGPGIGGQIRLRGEQHDVAAILALPPAPKRFLRKPGPFREVELAPGDAATLLLDAAGDVRLQLSFEDPPETVGRPRFDEPLLFKTTFLSASLSLLLLLGVLVVGNSLPSEPRVMTAERIAKYVAPVVDTPKFKAAVEEQAKAEAARKKREREAAEAKRMKGDEGKLGRQDATAKDTVLPKGRQDVLRDKVAKTGLLAALGMAKAAGSGLGRLLTTNDAAEYDQALNGIAGAKLVAGKGAGGLGSAGTGLGGGGTGFGRIQGSGDLDVGAGRGKGRKGPGLGLGKEKEVSVGMETGTPDAEGGLTKEQINRVVRAHAAAVKYCYEKELQRAPQLSGKVELYWVIRTDGSVDRVKVAVTTLANRNVEGCIERQVKNWQFPKSDAQTIVQSYPFLFKGGA